MKAFGRLDIMVNNAGIWRPVHPCSTQPNSNTRRCFKVNLKSAFFGTQLAAKQMIQPGRAAGESLTSLQYTRIGPCPAISAYCLSKGGMRMLTRTVGVELAPQEIPRRWALAQGGDSPSPSTSRQCRTRLAMAKLDAAIPLGRMAQPERDRERGGFSGRGRLQRHHRDNGFCRRRPHAEQPRALTRHIPAKPPIPRSCW